MNNMIRLFQKTKRNQRNLQLLLFNLAFILLEKQTGI